MTRAFAVLGLAGAAVLASTVATTVPASADAPAAVTPPRGSFDVIYAVLLSPRCKNCHPMGDAPLQGDQGRPHAMNISRTSAASGLACTTCHRAKNAEAPHGPPGAPNWRLPASDMPLVFEGKSPRDLCEQLKDPARNGHKTLAELEEHFDHDPFIHWGWQPGAGRTVPPVTHAVMMDSVRAWVKAGGPCP